MGFRLHLVATLHGLQVGVELTGAKADERTVLLDILTDPHLADHRPGQTLIADKNYYGAEFEAELAATGVQLLRPARKGESDPPGVDSSNPYDRPSSPSSTPSKASSTSNATAGEP